MKKRLRYFWVDTQTMGLIILMIALLMCCFQLADVLCGKYHLWVQGLVVLPLWMWIAPKGFKWVMNWSVKSVLALDDEYFKQWEKETFGDD